MTQALTVKRIERIAKDPAPASRQEIPDGLLPNLYLVRQTSKALSWCVRYRHAGQSRKLTLGQFPGVGLEAARALGAKALRSAAEGRDPAREKQDAKAAAQRQAAEEDRGKRDLFENVAREFLERHAIKNTREKSWRETSRILGLRPSPDGPANLVDIGGDVMAAWRGRKVQEITRRDIIALLDGIADRGSGVMANRTLSAIRRLFNWALARDVIQSSPCALVKPPAPERSRDRVLSDDELRLVWNAAEADGWPFGPVVKLMALTGQREGEVAGMRWSELDMDNQLWTLPATRTKNHEAHTIPLADAAVDILKSLPHIRTREGFVFAGRAGKPVSGFARVKVRLDEAITKANKGTALPGWVLHDLRRTMASGMARLGVQLPVIEKTLNHASGSFAGVAGVYQRHSFADEKRSALAAWASHVDSVVSGKRPTNVVALRK